MHIYTLYIYIYTVIRFPSFFWKRVLFYVVRDCNRAAANPERTRLKDGFRRGDDLCDTTFSPFVG